jgi:hypothetical protein
LADFIAVPTALRVIILTIVFTTTLPIPPSAYSSRAGGT